MWAIWQRTNEGEFSNGNWKWWKKWDGYYDLNGEMIQLPRWMCYDQQLTVVKQKCKEFVKVAIQWIWRDMFKKKEGIYFKFSVSFIDFSLHILVFLFHHFLTTNNKEMKTVMNQWTCQLIKWWSNTSDGDVSYLTMDQFKMNSVKTVGNGERYEMDTTTCMVKWSNYQDGWVCDITNSWQWWNKNVKNL